MKEGKVNKNFRKSECDIIFKDGRVFFLEEEDTEERPIEDFFKPFDKSFCKLSLINEVKTDSLEEE